MLKTDDGVSAVTRFLWSMGVVVGGGRVRAAAVRAVAGSFTAGLGSDFVHAMESCQEESAAARVAGSAPLSPADKLPPPPPPLPDGDGG